MRKANGIILRERYEKEYRKWLYSFIIINIIWFILVAICYVYFIAPRLKQVSKLSQSNNSYVEYKVKFEFLKYLRHKGMSLGQGIDIAEEVFKAQSLGLPVELVLGVMKRESDFTVSSVSHKGALGIMQIMPKTWAIYVTKLNLDVSIQAAFDPKLNVRVGIYILQDLYSAFKERNLSEEDARALTLSAYEAGLSGGLRKSYIKGVIEETKRFSERLNIWRK